MEWFLCINYAIFACLLLWVWHCATRKARGRIQLVPSRPSSAAAEETADTTPLVVTRADAATTTAAPTRAPELLGARAVVIQAILVRARLHNVIIGHALGRTVMLMLSPSFMAWVCPWTYVQDFEGSDHPMRVHYFLLALCLSSLGFTCVFGRARGRSIMDVVAPLPKPPPASWYQGGYALAALEVLRFWLLMIVAAGGALTQSNTVAVTHLKRLYYADLKVSAYGIVVVAVGAITASLLFSGYVVALLLGKCKHGDLALASSPPASPEVIDAWVEALVARAEVGDLPQADWNVLAWQERTVGKITFKYPVPHWLALPREVTLTARTSDSELKIALASPVPLLVTVIGPLVLDVIFDIITATNYMKAGHVVFGTLNMALLMYTTTKDFTKWRFLYSDFKTTVKIGYYTDNLMELIASETEDEAVATTLINTFGLPYAASTWDTFFTQVCSLCLGLKGLAMRMVQRQMGI